VFDVFAEAGTSMNLGISVYASRFLTLLKETHPSLPLLFVQMGGLDETNGI